MGRRGLIESYCDDTGDVDKNVGVFKICAAPKWEFICASSSLKTVLLNSMRKVKVLLCKFKICIYILKQKKNVFASVLLF